MGPLHQAISLLLQAHNALDIEDSVVDYDDEEDEAVDLLREIAERGEL